ncbi:MAG: hypothetical protein NC217_08435 [Muribaculaceae bacterium]|nr:hypothetical protein [Muribaculaceae bacterium]
MENANVMNKEMRNQADAQVLFERAKEDIALDMKSRDIGAIMWDNAQAGFHYPPEVTVTNSDGKSSVWTIHGIYRVSDTLYLIGPGAAVGVDNYYKKGITVKPIVHTMTEDEAERTIGIPNEGRGYTTQGTVQEWLTIADCYFAALNLINKI